MYYFFPYFFDLNLLLFYILELKNLFSVFGLWEIHIYKFPSDVWHCIFIIIQLPVFS